MESVSKPTQSPSSGFSVKLDHADDDEIPIDAGLTSDPLPLCATPSVPKSAARLI